MPVLLSQTQPDKNVWPPEPRAFAVVLAESAGSVYPLTCGTVEQIGVEPFVNRGYTVRDCVFPPHFSPLAWRRLCRLGHFVSSMPATSIWGSR